MTKKQAWVEAIRPRTLPLSLAGIIMGSGIAFYQGFGNWLIFGLALITTILFQILSNLANDLGDGMKGTDNHERIGPTRAVQSGLISHKEMKVAVIATSVLSAISASILLYYGAQGMTMNIIIFYSILALLCVLAAITYTVGKKAYGYNGFGDVMVFLFFGLVSVLGVYSLYTNLFDWNNILPACTIGLLSVAVLNLNNMRDYASDKKSNKNTLVVKMGPDFAKLYHVITIMIALICLFAFLVNVNNLFLFLCLMPTIIIGIHVQKVMKTKSAKEFDPELKKVALSTFGISVLFFIATLFS